MNVKNALKGLVAVFGIFLIFLELPLTTIGIAILWAVGVFDKLKE